VQTLLRKHFINLLTFISPTLMSTDSIPPLHPSDMPPPEVVSSFGRLRDTVADSIFAASRTFPRLLTLRSTPRAWTFFRILLGVAGAAVIVLPLSLWNAWAFTPVGLVLFTLAVLLPPLRQEHDSRDAIAKLGAYMVLDAGNLSRGNDDEPLPLNFYLTPTRVWALDQQLRPMVVIPADEISMATAFPAQSDWILRVRWQENSAEFIFAGLFAERRARIAEAGLRHLIHQAEPLKARAHAAGA
jgi:hypothetical protein